MILRSISLKNVAGATEPTSFDVSDGATFCRLPAELAPAVPYVVLTLLYPDEMSTSDLARLTGPMVDSAWRMSFTIAGRDYRLSRGFSPDSVLFEERRSASDWERVAGGASAVRTELGSRLKLPPPTVMEGLNAWINVSMPEETTTEESAVSELQLVGTEDLLNTLYEENAVRLDTSSRLAVSDSYRRAKTAEFIDDQIVAVEDKLADAIKRMGAVIDDGGELQRLQSAMAETPALRELTDAERAALETPDARREEFERKIGTVNEELTRAPSAAPKASAKVPALLTNPVFVLGVALTLGVTIYSIVGGVGMRRLAFGNIVAMGIALAGYLRHVQDMEDGSKAGRKRGSLERRFQQLESEREAWSRTYEQLRGELGVKDLAEYDRIRTRRARLEAKETELRTTHESAFETEEYQRYERRKERIEAQLRLHKQAKARIGDADTSAFELHGELQRAGLDPAVALWRPDDERRDLARCVKRLGQIASKYRLISESGLHPKTVASWLKVATRILGRPVEGLTMSAEHAIEDGDGNDALKDMTTSEAIAIVEALRMSLHLTLVKASAPGIHPFSIQVHTSRLPDETIRRRLLKMYNGLGEKLQVLCIDAKE